MSVPIPVGYIVQNIAEMTAPLLLGTVWNWTLHGVLITQFYVYTYNFPDDSKRLKYLVYGIIFLETVQSGLALGYLYYWFGSGFGDVTRLFGNHISLWGGPVLVGSVTAVIVQLFFAHRIWVLSEKKFWRVCLMVSWFSTVSAISEVVGSIYFQADPKAIVDIFSDEIVAEMGGTRQLWIFALTWLAGSVLTDGLITLSMLYLLKKRRTEGTSSFSKNAVSKIVRLTVETNLLTTTVTIVALLLTAIRPDTNWCHCPIAIMGKLYANALLVSLNNRVAIRDGPARVVATRFPEATLSNSKRPNDTSDCTYFQLDRPPSAMIFTPSGGSVRRSRVSERGEESLVIDIA
ncbi:hypothetical protein EI94DRAFT_1762375 [Lactarius quietus]|nr:hypothetical protein EI94DRAFT_1762375 [Lactarius quietus]